MSEDWWPDDDNEWATWHEIFYNRDANNDIKPVIQNNSIVVIKSCFPSSSLWGVGSAADTLQPTNKTIYNYKWHWRKIISVMEKYPENFFVIWTNAPLVANETDDQEARLSDTFCRWAKDTLAVGADAVFGTFPANVFVFDFFHKLADSSGKLPLQYASDEWDSHPNSAATELVAPQFVSEIFDAAIAYEMFTDIELTQQQSVVSFQLKQNYPNPFNPSTTIEFALPKSAFVTLKIYNLIGEEVASLIAEKREAGIHQINWDASGVPSGVYLYRLEAGDFVRVKKLILMR